MLYVNIYVVFHRKKIGTVKLIILFKIKDFYRNLKFLLEK